MSDGQILDRAKRGDAGGIDLVMGEVIVPLDVFEVYSSPNAVSPIPFSQITEEVRIVDDVTEVAFEMAMIHGIEPDQCREQPSVSLRACGEDNYCRV